jgi:hypothetical protein
MIIIRDNAVWWRRPDGAETQATPQQCATEIERLRKAIKKTMDLWDSNDGTGYDMYGVLKSAIDGQLARETKP